jgi:hypothetical protein
LWPAKPLVGGFQFGDLFFETCLMVPVFDKLVMQPFIGSGQFGELLLYVAFSLAGFAVFLPECFAGLCKPGKLLFETGLGLLVFGDFSLELLNLPVQFLQMPRCRSFVLFGLSSCC